MLYVDGDAIVCKACDYKVRVNEYYDLVGVKCNKIPKDIDEWYKPTDINNYDGSILTFADCPLLTEVEDKYGLNPWQKKNLFDNTPWLKAQETK